MPLQERLNPNYPTITTLPYIEFEIMKPIKIYVYDLTFHLSFIKIILRVDFPKNKHTITKKLYLICFNKQIKVGTLQPALVQSIGNKGWQTKNLIIAS